MAGIDTITKQILQDADEKADSIIREANEKARRAMQDATNAAASEQRKAQMKAEEAVKDYASRIQSQIGLQKRQQMLKAKQDLIEDIINSAYEQVKNQDDASYFSMMTTLIEKHLHADKGELLLSEKDAARLPAGFMDKVEALAKAAGGTITLSSEKAPIEDGFILKYPDPESDFGGIEENCSLKALFADKKEQLQDTVNQILWQ